MDLVQFVLTVILVTASGALAPGPLFFATISHGAKNGVKTGLLFSVAHTLVEFSLVLVLAFGLLTLADEPAVKTIIGLSGGSVLIVFGLLQLRAMVYPKFDRQQQKPLSFPHLFLIGIAFTGLNPYFVLWWMTVGAQLIIISLAFASFLGVVFMYVCHVWMDYVWLSLVAYLSKKGSKIIGNSGYRVLLGIFGGVLIYFGITFIWGVF
jgi:threonine/homoserine/homoserine lactone efflux protein